MIDDDFDPWADFAAVEAEVAAGAVVPQIPDPRHYRSGLTQERTAFSPRQFVQNWRDGYR